MESCSTNVVDNKIQNPKPSFDIPSMPFIENQILNPNQNMNFHSSNYQTLALHSLLLNQLNKNGTNKSSITNKLNIMENLIESSNLGAASTNYFHNQTLVDNELFKQNSKSKKM